MQKPNKSKHIQEIKNTSQKPTFQKNVLWSVGFTSDFFFKFPNNKYLLYKHLQKENISFIFINSTKYQTQNLYKISIQKKNIDNFT